MDVCEKYPEAVGVELEESERLKKVRQSQVAVVTEGQEKKEVEPDAIDPLSPELLDVEYLLRSEGLSLYLDQSGRLWTSLATYWIKHGEFSHARTIFEEGISTVLTLRDFTQIFDAYAEFSESYISSLMEDEEDEDGDGEVDKCMKDFEDLMDRRPFLVNDVLLRRNQNDVQEWEKRVALHGVDDAKVRSFTTFFLPPPGIFIHLLPFLFNR